MTAKWHYKTTEPFFQQGKDTTRPNFSREERSEVGILIREGLQNPLDAIRDNSTEPVRVSFRNLPSGSFDKEYLEEIVTSEFRARLEAASGVSLPSIDQANVFVIEDFGTKGLLGNVSDYNADGKDQNWNAFWHREGEGAKGKASNGGAGQGKVTYFVHSLASVVLGLTVRSSDSRRLMMGRAAFLRDYQFTDGKKYYRSSYFTVSDKEPAPESDPHELDAFSKAFRLQRTPDDSGLSLVMPYAKPFSDDEALESVVLDFYMPIAAKRLEVTIGDIAITSETIDQIADTRISDERVAELSSSFSSGYRKFSRSIIDAPKTDVTLNAGWNKDRVLPPAAFPDGSLELLRAKLEANQRIGITLPITVAKKTGERTDTSFDVFIEIPEGLAQNEEAFLRRDLLIGGESHMTAGSLTQRARSLTWIHDLPLSDFLLAAEEPTHLKWNASLARDKAEYQSPDLLLRSIRQAVPRLLAQLLNSENKKDFKALAKFFARPIDNSNSKKGGTDKSSGNKTEQGTPPPPPVPKPFKIESSGTSIRVVPNGSKGPAEDQLPLEASLELAYEGLDQDPFAAYDPYDFDLTQASAFPTSARGASIVEKSGNRITFSITSQDFEVSITGFDPNVRTRARLSYTVTSDNGDTVDA